MGKLELGFITQGPYSKNIGSRTYLMENDYAYKLFQLKNKEFTYTVDDSNLGCGLNGALYFVQMDADGGKSQYGNAGAEYGLGYCDAQCPHDIKFINGEANDVDWKPSETDSNSGTGKYGSCCTEIDIWEANSISTAFTMHACATEGQQRCDGTTPTCFGWIPLTLSIPLMQALPEEHAAQVLVCLQMLSQRPQVPMLSFQISSLVQSVPPLTAQHRLLRLH